MDLNVHKARNPMCRCAPKTYSICLIKIRSCAWNGTADLQVTVDEHIVLHTPTYTHPTQYIINFIIGCTLLFQSAKKTGRVIVAHEAPLTSGFGAELAASIQVCSPNLCKSLHSDGYNARIFYL